MVELAHFVLHGCAMCMTLSVCVAESWLYQHAGIYSWLILAADLRTLPAAKTPRQVNRCFGHSHPYLPTYLPIYLPTFLPAYLTT